MKTRNAKRKKSIVKAKAIPPEIYVKVTAEERGNWYTGDKYAKAHIRVKNGEYQYLEWWDGGTVRSLYLGRKRPGAKKS